MNLKEAFRFQNKLQALMHAAQSILDDSRNICKTETTYLRKKVMAEAENETTVDVAPSEYADRIDADKYAKDAMEAVRYADEIHEILA